MPAADEGRHAESPYRELGLVEQARRVLQNLRDCTRRAHWLSIHCRIMTNSATTSPPAVVIRSFITTAATGVIGKIHTKMPVTLLLEDGDEWLNPDISEPERLLPLLKQFPDNTMEAIPL